jgi:hypothetical protein
MNEHDAKQVDGLILKIIKEATYHFSKVTHDYRFNLSYRAEIELKIINELKMVFDVNVDRRKYKTRISLKPKSQPNEVQEVL